MTVDALLGLDRPALSALIRAGHPIDPEALKGWEYNGLSLGLPRFVEKLTWKKFKKVFLADGTGYNEAVEQNALDEPWIALTKSGEPIRYGWFDLRAVGDTRVPREWDRGLLIDYRPHNPLPPMRFVKDPLVALAPGDADLLLGVSFLALGPLRAPLPTYFSLVRGAPAPEA